MQHDDTADILDEVGGEIELVIHMHKRHYDAHLHCGVCGSKGAVTLPQMYVMFAVAQDGTTDMSSRLPVVVTVCSDCGVARMFVKALPELEGLE